MSPWRKAQIPALVAIVAFYGAHAWLLVGRLQDDAFISFRYARNLAEGAGLVWNIGERVEGYTNFLWVLLFSAVFSVSKTADPVAVARGVSLVSGAAALAGSFLLVRRMAPRSELLPVVPPLLLAGSWAFTINTMTGLETVFLAALVTAGALLLVIEHEDLRYRGSSVVLGLAALTRPEAVGLSLLLGVHAAMSLRGRGAEARRYLIRLCAPFLGIVGAHEVFRLAYYGAWVPNTFVVKAGRELPPGLPTPGSYVLDFLRKGLDPVFATALLAAVFVVARLKDARSRIVMIGGLYGFINVAVSGADFMVGFRYFVPYMPLLCVCAALGGSFLVESWTSPKAPRNAKEARRSKGPPVAGFRVEAALVVGALFLATRGYARSRDELKPFEDLRRRVAEDTGRTLGQWMADRLPADTVVAAVDIGELGYTSRMRIVDLTGLTDRAIARRPGNVLDRELDTDDVFGRGIGAFVLVAAVAGPAGGRAPFEHYATPAAARALLTDARMEQGYTFAARYPDYIKLVPGPTGGWEPVERGSRPPGARTNSYYLELYLRRDLAAAVGRN